MSSSRKKSVLWSLAKTANISRKPPHKARQGDKRVGFDQRVSGVKGGI